MGADAAPAGHALPVAHHHHHHHTYATMMLVAGVTPGFCAKQLGHSVEMFLSTDAKRIDGRQNALEMNHLEAAIAADLSPIYPKQGR